MLFHKLLVYTERQFHTVTEFQNGGKRTHMPKLLYIYDFSFKFDKTKCRKNLLLYIMLATEHLRTVIMRIGDKSNIESKITKMRCPNPKYALKVLFQKTLHAVRIPLNLYIFFYFTPYKTLQWKKNE